MPHERVFVYGHSLGAMVAAAVAMRRPKRVTGVVLEDPPFHTMGERIHESPLGSYFAALRGLAGSAKPVGELARELAEVSYGPGGSLRCGDTRDATTLRFAASCLRRLDPAVLEPIAAGRWLDPDRNRRKTATGAVQPPDTIAPSAVSCILGLGG